MAFELFVRICISVRVAEEELLDPEMLKDASEKKKLSVAVSSAVRELAMFAKVMVGEVFSKLMLCRGPSKFPVSQESIAEAPFFSKTVSALMRRPTWVQMDAFHWIHF